MPTYYCQALTTLAFLQARLGEQFAPVLDLGLRRGWDADLVARCLGRTTDRVTSEFPRWLGSMESRIR